MNTIADILKQLRLLESSTVTQTLNEDSPLVKMFGNDPLSLALAKHIHSKYKLSHNATPAPYTESRLRLTEFKFNPDNFFIFKGPKGWAAMKPNYEGEWDGAPNEIPYVAYFALEDAVTDDGDVRIGVKQLVNKRAGLYKRPDVRAPNIVDEIREYIGGGRLEVWFIPGAQGKHTPDNVSIDREKIAARQVEADPSEVYANLNAILVPAVNRARVQRISRAVAGGASDEEAYRRAGGQLAKRVDAFKAAMLNNTDNPLRFELAMRSAFPQLLDWARSQAGITRKTAHLSAGEFAAIIEKNIKSSELRSQIESWLLSEGAAQ